MELIKKYIYEQLASDELSNLEAMQMLQELHQQDEKGSFDDDIAIIGLAGNFGGAEDIDEFWQSLREGRDFITSLPRTRRDNIEQYLDFHGLSEDEMIIRKGAYLKEIDRFDPEFFNISAREASLMDPNQRLFLETSWQAIEDAGYGHTKLDDTRTGVFVGFSHDFGDDYKQLIKEYKPSLLSMATLGNINSVISGRLAYLLNLTGPAMLIDTACSSALVAVHQACQSIRSGDCEMAIAGGVKLWLIPAEPKQGGEFGGDTGPGIGIEAEDGRCKTFDDNSSGAGFGEGAGAVLLKPLKQAKEDRDPIYAVIKGGSVNQDGRSIGLSAPNILAQERVIQQAWDNADIDPTTISYIEAHGTGTNLGDPIEIHALQNSFAKFTEEKQFCGIGSVKSNLGHLDNAAGIVGLIKLILSLKHKELPPSLHFETPNREIDFINSPLIVNDKLKDWPQKEGPIRAGISAFGLSGTNCHLILEEGPKQESSTFQGEYNLLTLSAKGQEPLIRLVEQYIEFLKEEKTVELTDLCYTANTGRGDYRYRLAFIAKNREELMTRLKESMKYNFDDLINGRGIYYGDTKANGETARNQIKDLKFENIENDKKSMVQLAEQYVKGNEIIWNNFYGELELNRINLPVYPFDHKKCWVQPNLALKKDKVSNKERFYRAEWVRREADGWDVLEEETILVFKDDGNLATELINQLKKRDNRIIEVEFGNSFHDKEDNNYQINGQMQDYYRLLQGLPLNDISRIIHLSTVNLPQSDGLNSIEMAQNRGVYSLFNLVKALKGLKGNKETEVVLVSDLVSQVVKYPEAIKPENSPLFGLAKVVNQEYPEIRCRCLDIDQKIRISDLIYEIGVERTAFQTAYRNGERYIQILKRTKLDRSDSKEIELKDNGVYLITGGLGGIGLEIAKSLSEQGQPKLAMINRTPLPDRSRWQTIIEQDSDQKMIDKIMAVKEIETKGAEVISYSCDVTNLKEMGKTLDRIRDKYGEINGIIHAAGLPGDGIIINRGLEEFKKVLEPKIHGTWILDYLTSSDQLDFFALFSSISAVFGGPGQGDYTAANLYLNSFAEYRNQKRKGTVTINWTGWRETGMALENDVDFENLILKPLTNQEGTRLFRKILKRGETNLLVGELNHRRFHQLADSFPIELSEGIQHEIEESHLSDQESPGELQVEIKEDVGDIEKEVAQIFAQVLGTDHLSVTDNFYDLGGDSIIALTLINNLNKKFGGVLDVTDLFSNSTIRKLADLIKGKLSQDDGQSGSSTDKEDKTEQSDKELMDILTELEEGGLSSEEGIDLINDLEE